MSKLVEKYIGKKVGKNRDKIQMQCMECGARFKKKIGPKTFEVKCPKCKSTDVETI